MPKNTTYLLIKKQSISKFKKKKKYDKISLIIIFKIILFSIFSILFKRILYLPEKKEKSFLFSNHTSIINSYLSSIPLKYKNQKEMEKKLLFHLFSLKDISNKEDDPSIMILKSKLLIKMTKFTEGKNFSKIKKVFITNPSTFGNYMIMVNTIMYYCELFGINNIYFDSSYNWYIKNNINTDKFNISIISKAKINCNDNNIVCFSLSSMSFFFFLYYPSFIKPQIRINLLKNEIKKNLPNVTIESNDIIIHIRSGGIFKTFHPFYSQPPLCFYKSILKNFTFKKIFLIAIGKENPTINHLIKEFPNIIYKNNSLQKDISYLINAYNLVGSVSSLLMTTIILNDNLINYWEYDIYRRSEKFCHLNLEYYNFPRKFKIYQMKPSENYKNEMFVWSNDSQKFRLMIEEKCTNNFAIIKPIA